MSARTLSALAILVAMGTPAFASPPNTGSQATPDNNQPRGTSTRTGESVIPAPTQVDPGMTVKTPSMPPGSTPVIRPPGATRDRNGRKTEIVPK
jgi:hypothetical protein